MVKEDGNLELDFSSDYGKSYYTNNKNVCPYSYIAKKVPDDIEGQGRALAREGDVNRRMSFAVVAIVAALKLIFCAFGNCVGLLVPI